MTNETIVSLKSSRHTEQLNACIGLLDVTKFFMVNVLVKILTNFSINRNLFSSILFSSRKSLYLSVYIYAASYCSLTRTTCLEILKTHAAHCFSTIIDTRWLFGIAYTCTEITTINIIYWYSVTYIMWAYSCYNCYSVFHIDGNTNYFIRIRALNGNDDWYILETLKLTKTLTFSVSFPNVNSRAIKPIFL